MPDLPHGFREAAYAPSTAEAVITLLKLVGTSHGTLLFSDYPKSRLSIDPFVEGTSHGGEDYVFGLVSVAAPGADGGALPETTMVIANTDGEYDWLDEDEIEDVTAEVIEVLKSDPEIIIRHFTHLTLAEVAPGAETLTLTLGLEQIKEERFPTHGMSKSRAPGLFAG